MAGTSSSTTRLTFDVSLFEQPFDEPLDDATFNAHALRTFAHQLRWNAPYAAYCARRGRTASNTDHWTKIPALPTAAFKEVVLATVAPDDAEAVFRTSGTTRGAEKRGAHYIADLSIYHASLHASFNACVRPDGVPLRMLSLIPDAALVPDSSLSHMVSAVMQRSGVAGSDWFATPDAGIDQEAFVAALDAACRDAVPVCILGTSFAFVRLLDTMRERFVLPRGSRLMDTGGYKGRSREVSAEELRAQYRAVFGIDAASCVNEYGMTEMCSQLYDSTLRDVVIGRDAVRRKLVPPWVRTRAVHPETLEPVEDGTIGILQHFDLANANSVMAVQTEDLGRIVEGGVELLGRAPGAAPRGCSIAMDILLEAVTGREQP